jgi:hypothetical protein
MEAAVDDRFVVFALRPRAGDRLPQAMEQEVVACPSYQEAQRVRRAFQAVGRACVIRFMGEAGGGD